jgi:hypothetical protein
MNQSKLIENILKASKTISAAHGAGNYMVTSSKIASILKNLDLKVERKRKIKKILWS